MKIAVVSKADATGGGASRVANDIVVALNERGIHARHLATRSSQGWSDLRRPIFGPRPTRVLLTRLQNLSREAGFGELIPIEALSVLIATQKFDVVHFHDTSSAFSPLTLYLVSKLKPVVWTFHDCSPFTGGCLYPQATGCRRYLSGCGNCPQLGEWPLAAGIADLTSQALKQRRFLHEKANLTYITPSTWMKETALESGLLKRSPIVISNMVDTEQFSPSADAAALRRRLCLPQDRPVITLSSGLLSDGRKGIKDGIECVKSLAHLNPVLVLIGNPDPSLSKTLSGIEFVPTGYIRDRAYLAEWLSASDLFLFTSKADNQPLSIAEALACGTPVYGYPTGGATEMIVPGETGRFVAQRVPGELAKIIETDLQNGKTKDMRKAARASALDMFDRTQFVNKHIAVYRNLMT
jgi:glycosyltransferase involved in cell wall biosynthesis